MKNSKRTEHALFNLSVACPSFCRRGFIRKGASNSETRVIEISIREKQKDVDPLSNFKPAYDGIEFPVSASGFQSDNMPISEKSVNL